MTRLVNSIVVAFVAVVLLFLGPQPAACWGIADCNKTRADFLEAGNLTYYPKYFVDNYTPTYEGCSAICENPEKPLPSVAEDCGSRLFAWLLPGLVLVVAFTSPHGSVAFRLWAAVHPLSDPVDAALSLAFRLLWLRWCCSNAEQLTVRPDRDAPGGGSNAPGTVVSSSADRKTWAATLKAAATWTLGFLSSGNTSEYQRDRVVVLEALAYLKPDDTLEQCVGRLQTSPPAWRRASIGSVRC